MTSTQYTKTKYAACDRLMRLKYLPADEAMAEAEGIINDVQSLADQAPCPELRQRANSQWYMAMRAAKNMRLWADPIKFGHARQQFHAYMHAYLDYAVITT